MSTKSASPTLPEWPFEPGFFRFSESLNPHTEKDMEILRAWVGWFATRGIETSIQCSRRNHNVALYRRGVESEISMIVSRRSRSRRVH